MSEDETPKEPKKPVVGDAPGQEGDSAADAVNAEEAARLKAEAAKRAKAAALAKKAAEEAAKPPWERNPEAPEWQEADADPLAVEMTGAHGEAIHSARTFAGDLVLEVSPEGLEALCADLKAQGYTLMVDVCGVHFPDREETQFEVVYHVFNLQANRRARVKVAVAEGVGVPSMTSVWRGANWPEREVYDMFGVRFEGHPDMTRILLWEGFNGHPLRKEFPVEGVDTGAAIYPEEYGSTAGPVAGTGTGWRPPAPPEEEMASDERGDSGTDS